MPPKQLDQEEPTKGILVNLATWQSLTFQYNPPDIADDRTLEAQTIQVVGASHPRIVPVSGGSRVISFQLLFYYYKKSLTEKFVKQQCSWLQGLTYPLNSELVGVVFPPVQFSYGDLYDLTVRVKSASVKYPGTFQRKSLLPSRATVDLQLEEMVTSPVFLQYGAAYTEGIYTHYDPEPTAMFGSGD